MMNVRLCDAILCQPDLSDKLCVRCVREQYDYLLEVIDDCEPLDYDYLDDYNREIKEQLKDIENDLPF